MLFTTLDFVFVFLPVVFLIYFVLMRFRLTTWAFRWLGLASLVFYGWGDYRLLAVLGVSITVNFLVGNSICAMRE